MSYGTVAAVTAAFDPTQWDPSTSLPNTATVTEALTRHSAVLEGRIGHVVTVPVNPSASPRLTAICDLVVVLRTRADVYDTLYPPAPSEEAKTRQSTVWRAEAEDLVKSILAGGVADGTLLGSGRPQAPGAPIGNFPGSPAFSRDQRF